MVCAFQVHEVLYVRRAQDRESPASGYDSDVSLEAFDLSEGPDTEGDPSRPTCACCRAILSYDALDVHPPSWILTGAGS